MSYNINAEIHINSNSYEKEEDTSLDWADDKDINSGLY